MRPKRIQRRRTKGWRMPKNTVYVGRPSKWGNPFRVGMDRKRVPKHYRLLALSPSRTGPLEASECKRLYAQWATTAMEAYMHELRGKNLCCWCKLSDPCHAQVLLEIAND